MAVKTREVRLSLGNTFVSFKSENDDGDLPEKPSTVRERVGYWLDRLMIQTTIVLLVICDILILVALLLINQRIIQSPPNQTPNESVEATQEGVTTATDSAENVLHIINITILFSFSIEVVLRVIARGLYIFKDILQVFDCCLVVLVFLLYITLTAANVTRTATYSIGLFIIFRIWRIHRIYEGIQAQARRKVERISNVHRKARQDAEEQNKECQAKLEQRQREIGNLKEHLLALQRQTKSGSLSLHKRASSEGMLSDQFTSGEDYARRSTGNATVHVEVSTTGVGKRTPNGSLPSGTPHGSLHSLATSSCSHLTLEAGDNPASDKNSARMYPDLVEQTHQESKVKDTGSDDYIFTSCTSPTEGNQQNGDVLKSNGCDYSENAVVAEENIVKETKVNNANVDTKMKPGNQGAVFTETRKDDKVTLLTAEEKNRESGEFGSYTNPTFETSETSPAPSPPVLTSEELTEIKRISEVPFDSNTYLNNDGIPMTDL